MGESERVAVNGSIGVAQFDSVDRTNQPKGNDMRLRLPDQNYDWLIVALICILVVVAFSIEIGPVLP